jgi:hypothetical protein
MDRWPPEDLNNFRVISVIAEAFKDRELCGYFPIIQHVDCPLEARSRLCRLSGTCSQDSIYSKSICMSKHRVYPAIIQKLRNFAFAVLVGESLTKPV